MLAGGARCGSRDAGRAPAVLGVARRCRRLGSLARSALPAWLAALRRRGARGAGAVCRCAALCLARALPTASLRPPGLF